MNEAARERLAEHYARYREAKPSHPELLRAAEDPALPDAFLVECAVRDIEADYEGEELDRFCLVVLCAKRSEEWMAEVYRMLRDSRPALRELASCVLTQYGFDHGERPAAALHVRLLHEAFQAEDAEGDPDGLMTALANQGHADALPILLEHRAHPVVLVRYAIQNHLIGYLELVPDRREEILDALLEYAEDPDDLVRSSFWYDVGCIQELWEARREQLTPLLHRWREEPHPDARADLRRAYAVRIEGADFYDWEPPDED